MDLRTRTELHAWSAGGLLALGAQCISAPCSAQAVPRASLVVTRGESAQDCPDALQLAEQVRAVAGGNVLSVGLAAPMETWIQVTIARNFGSYTARISALGAHHGTRVLEDLGPSCSSLADAIAVTLAIFLDPYADTPLPEPRAVLRAHSAPQAPSVSRNPEPAARPVRFPQLLLDGSGGVALNLLEHSQPFLGANVGMRLDARWSFALGGAFVFPDSKPTSGGELDLSLSYASLAACGRAWGDPESLRMDWCAAALYGSFAASGKHYIENHSERGAWGALSLGPVFVLPFSRSLSWLFTAQGIVPFMARNFTVQSAGVQNSAFRSASVAGLLSFGVRGAL